MKHGDHLEHKFGSSIWSISTKYIARSEDEINVNTTEKGLAVDSDGNGERAPEIVHRQILTREEINSAQTAIPIYPVSGIVRVISWRPSK
jgi:hypothetical protein